MPLKSEECVRGQVESMDEGQQQLLCQAGSCLCLLYAPLLLAFPLTSAFCRHWILNLGIHPTFISKPLTYLQKHNSHFWNSFDSVLDSLAWMPSFSGSLCLRSALMPTLFPLCDLIELVCQPHPSVSPQT